MKISRENVINFIVYGLTENNIDISTITPLQYERIFEEYIRLCEELKQFTNNNMLDTFKRAACLLIAISNSELSPKKRVNASIALDSAYKMCEMPFCINEETNTLVEMQPIDFSQVFDKEPDFYNEVRNMLLDSLTENILTPFNCYLNLKSIYATAVKKYNSKEPISILKRKTFNKIKNYRN